MSFRSQFVDKLNARYADDVLRRKSIDAEWRKLRGYFRAFIEDISNVTDFALATMDETDSEMSLRVEGHELSFRKHHERIQVMVDAQYIDEFIPTVDGFCLNFKEQQLMRMIDEYMRLAFFNTYTEL